MLFNYTKSYRAGEQQKPNESKSGLDSQDLLGF